MVSLQLGLDSFTGADLVFVRGGVKEAIEVSSGFTTSYNKAGGGATEGRDMAAGGSRDGPGEGRYSAPRHAYWQETSNIGKVGDAESYLGGL